MGMNTPISSYKKPRKISSNAVMIIDIDNCIVDSRPLDKYEPKDPYSREGWDEYQKHYEECTPNTFITTIVRNQMFQFKTTPVFITAREDTGTCREETEKMLNILFGEHNYRLFMRDKNDYSNDVEVKSKIYDNLVKTFTNINIVFAIDDKPEICELWKSKGIQTLCYSLPKIVT